MRYTIYVQAEPYIQVSDRPSITPERRKSKLEQRAAFAVAIRNGLNITQAAKAVGITRVTGSQWARQLRERNELERARSAIISRNELAETLSALVNDKDVDARDRINAGKAAAEVLGYNAPTKSIVETRIVHPSTLAWLESEDYIDATVETPMLPAAASAQLPALTETGGGPPKGSDVDAVQSPPKYLPDSGKSGGS